MVSDKKLGEYLEAIGEGSDGASGVCIAAVSGASAAALTALACNKTIGNDDFKKDEAILKALRMRSGKLRERFLELAEGAASATKTIDAASGKKREKALQAACEPALDVAKACSELLKLTKITAEKGNPAATPDIGAAALMADAGLQSASMGIRTMMKEMNDAKFLEDLNQKLSEVEFAAVEEVDEVMQVVLPRIEGEGVLAGEEEE